VFIKYNIVIEITVLYAQKLLDYRLSLMNVITETCHVHYMDKFGICLGKYHAIRNYHGQIPLRWGKEEKN
jgi:hypothetical protein